MKIKRSGCQILSSSCFGKYLKSFGNKNKKFPEIGFLGTSTNVRYLIQMLLVQNNFFSCVACIVENSDKIDAVLKIAQIQCLKLVSKLSLKNLLAGGTK